MQRKEKLRERLRIATKMELLLAAETLLADKGIQAANMALIAQTAGISVGCLYNYFSDKEELIAYIIEKRKDDLLSLMDAEITKNKIADFYVRLTGFTKVIVEYLSQHVSYSKIIFSTDAIVPVVKNLSKDKKKTKSTSIVEEFSQYFIPIISKGITEKIIKSAPEKYYLFMLLGLIRGALIYRIQTNLFLPQEDLKIILDIFLTGIKRDRK